MQKPVEARGQVSIVIEFSVKQPDSKKRQCKTFSAAPEDLDLLSAAELLKSAESYFEQRDFKMTVNLVEQALPVIDRLYSIHDVGKLRALRILRDSYLALNRGVEAKDCVEVGFAFFDDIMKSKIPKKENLAIGDPCAFARPVIRKLKTLRRSKDSESLRKRAINLSEKWRTFCQTS